MLDLSTNEWSTMRSTLKTRRYSTLVYNEEVDTMYYMGGQNNEGTSESAHQRTDKVEKYKFDVGETNGWTYTAHDCIVKLRMPACVSFKSYIYCYDGENNNHRLSVMNVHTEEWQNVGTHRHSLRTNGASIALVRNYLGGPAIIVVSGQNGHNFQNSKQGEVLFLNDPDDPTKITAKKMKVDHENNFIHAPMWDIEGEILNIHQKDKNIFIWDKTLEMFVDTGKSVTKAVERGTPSFKTTTRWEGTACNKNPGKFNHRFASCLDAFKEGLMMPDPGSSITIYLSGGSEQECFLEDPYSTGDKCPDGWIGKKGEEKCLKFHSEPEDNANAARQCYKEGGDLYQDEDEDWNEIMLDTTYFSPNYSRPVYPGYIHLGLHQKQSGNQYLYHKNGVRV